jgi:hypothetical protein
MSFAPLVRTTMPNRVGVAASASPQILPFAKDRGAAQNAQAALADERQRMYDSTFSSVSGGIRDLALGEIDLEAAAGAGRRGGRIFDVGVGALEREQRALGVGPMAGQTERTSLRRTLAEVDAANRKIDSDEGLREFAQRTSMGEYADRMAGAGNIYGQIADMEVNRKAQYEQAKAQRSANIMGAVGTVAGIAAMAI